MNLLEVHEFALVDVQQELGAVVTDRVPAHSGLCKLELLLHTCRGEGLLITNIFYS